ncbi:MAG: efflux RND transporter periplasmic adaptor subunit [Rhodoferax sp.]|uniref:efflux RND transporter periplasmic adaptor subunit n=1 Tax=Rhodoferax sp. TaxID=50421 RepID=UPI002632E760|nr:efflux RND transporter periplasmic adaptor subunit [Rhodoferax sp.]MDD5334700.1 efflux RND transporter periplasmic adaptor subunit [Rhodoferax sp.]
MKYHLQPRWIVLAVASLVLLGLASLALTDRTPEAKKPAAQVKPALTVNLTEPQRTTLPMKIEANGNLAAWQEASIGTEANGLRLAEVRVNVGDQVERGQVLATFAPDMILADLAQMRANLAQEEATLAEAAANAQRARELQTTGALSAQQINQYLTAERTAQARVEAQRAIARTQQLRLAQTQVLAPDRGVISARSATVGAVLPAGQELFRMIRQGRLEWRAEVSSADLAYLKPGMSASVTPANGTRIKGTLRMVAPTVDAATRMGLVYVDLPAHGAAKAGMFARGEFETGSGVALTLPQSAVLLRDGFSYVLRVGADSKVALTKVAVGRRAGERIEITGGLDAKARVVAAGGGFLSDGDTVRVVESAPAPKSAASASGAQAR